MICDSLVINPDAITPTEQRAQTAILLSGTNQASFNTHAGLVHSTQSLKRTRTEENHLVYHDSNVQQQKKRVVTRPVVDSRVASESIININASTTSGERIGEVLSGILSATSKTNSSFNFNIDI